jgi:outer membrane immunogenic protein
MPTYQLTKLVVATMLSPLILASGAIESRADAQQAPAYPGLPPPPLFYNWTGVYAGVHAGGGWADLGVGDTGTGFTGGGQVGFNYQVNQWVWGLEADISGSGIKNNLASFGTPFGPITANFNWNSLTTLAPRFGYASDTGLSMARSGRPGPMLASASTRPSALAAPPAGPPAAGWPASGQNILSGITGVRRSSTTISISAATAAPLSLATL